MTGKRGVSDGTQSGAGEQIRPRQSDEDRKSDSLRGGADPSGGQSSEVPRLRGEDSPDAGRGPGDKGRDITPLSTPSDGSPDARPTEDDLAKRESDRGDQ